MRLWHYELIKYLPKGQLVAQWRELNSIFKKQDKHILINYIYEYSKDDLYTYTSLVINEMKSRNYKIVKWDNYNIFFGNKEYKIVDKPYIKHHDFCYFEICYFNLKEKYIRGQKDFEKSLFEQLETLYNKKKLIK